VPLGFGLALVVLVGLGVVTLWSISQLVSANESVLRTAQLLERLQALMASVREVESSQVGLVLTGRTEYRASYGQAHADMLRIGQDLQEFVDTQRQRDQVRDITTLSTEVSGVFRRALSTRAPSDGSILDERSKLLSDRLIAAVAAMEHEERQALADRQVLAASRARTAQSHVIIASLLAFVTILIAALMVRRDVLERHRVTDRLERANATLADTVAEAQRHRDEITRLARLSHFLQGCRSSDEACVVIEKMAPTLFGAGGALYLASGTQLERRAAWDGGHTMEQTFSPDACWGIRQGGIHNSDVARPTPGCQHLLDIPSATCVPLVSESGTFGLLAILLSERQGASRATLLASVEQISAGLANLRLRESLRNQSLRDPLTGLYNRRFLHDALTRECHDARRHPERPVALLLLDLDYFKQVNDTSGHAAGDALLQALSELLGRTFRGSDIACRFGGEEFAVLLAETPLDVALRRAEALRVAIHGLHAHHGNAVLGGVTVSIGVTAASGADLSPEQLLEEADLALYEAKARGRDCCVAYTAAARARPLPFDVPSELPLA
jgi:diguanylate cyclase (GGDEF)-like protein